MSENEPDEFKPYSRVLGPYLGPEIDILVSRARIYIHPLLEKELDLIAVTSENMSLDMTLWSICAGVLPTAIATLYTELTPTARLGFQTAALVACIIGFTSFIRWMRTRNSLRNIISEIKSRKA
ncbi:MAG: hypothetical protein LAO78_11875 [Acidobacteriia bacterium]|nr:hypothetical protein [Terriglobia bacterium]